MTANACRSAWKRASTLSGTPVGPEHLERHRSTHGLRLLGEIDHTHATLPQHTEDGVWADRVERYVVGQLATPMTGAGARVILTKRASAVASALTA